MLYTTDMGMSVHRSGARKPSDRLLSPYFHIIFSEGRNPVIKGTLRFYRSFLSPALSVRLSLSAYITESRKLRNGWLVERPGLAVMANPSLK